MIRLKDNILSLLACLWLLSPSFSLLAEARDFVVVIDPGHGGKDPGALGRKGNEKTVNLNVSLKLGKLIKENHQDVKVIYTRTKDIFLPLGRRAEIANQAKADLFISIHTNSLARGRIARGTETYTLGLHKTSENLEVAQKENSVILIESDYQKRYAGFNPKSAESYIMFEFLQDKNMASSVELASFIQKQFKRTAKRIDKGVHQAGFLVLRETSMPSVLIELGYISTPDEERYLLSECGSSDLALSIYQAFKQYKNKHQDSRQGNRVGTPEVLPTEINQGRTEQRESHAERTQAQAQKTATNPQRTAVRSQSKPVFKIQFMTSDRKLPAGSRLFKGLSPVSHYVEKGIYKYTYCESTDYNMVLKTRRRISAKFKDAFVIAFKDGKKMNINQAIAEFKRNR